MRYYLNLGSNLGNPMRNIARAIAALSAGTGGCMVSHPVESEPWGFDSEHRFVNLCVALDSDLQPRELLRWTQSIERRLGSDAHRNPDGTYADRLIDIDIVAIHDTDHANPNNPAGTPITINTPTLTVPHPHLHDRPFFLQPYLQLLNHN